MNWTLNFIVNLNMHLALNVIVNLSLHLALFLTLEHALGPDFDNYFDN